MIMTEERSRHGYPVHSGDDFGARMRAAVSATGKARKAQIIEALRIEPNHPEALTSDPIEQALRAAVHAEDERGLALMGATAAEQVGAGAEPQPDTLAEHLAAKLDKGSKGLEPQLARALGIPEGDLVSESDCKCAGTLSEEARQILDGTYACQIRTGLSPESARRVLERLGQ
jgi:hypothetical protein